MGRTPGNADILSNITEAQHEKNKAFPKTLLLPDICLSSSPSLPAPII